MDDTFNDSIEKIDRVRRAIDIAKLPDFEFVAYIKPELLVTKPKMIHMLADMGLRGAFVGIESFNAQARTAIGKGTGIEKVIDACTNLATYDSKRKVLIHGNFIVGLPYESRDSILETQETMIKRQDELFRSWYWYPLFVRNDKISPKESLSLFDKNFEAYGYRIPENSTAWENDYFNAKSATKLAAELNSQANSYRKYGGWHVAGAWHAGRTDFQIDAETISQNYMGPELKKNARDRALLEYNRLTAQGNNNV
jgi:radical SAM superfamily enzyme YgiQ (UPF0313 family)